MLEDAEEFTKDTRLFGRTDRTATAGYHMRPFGPSMIEAYFSSISEPNSRPAAKAAFVDFALR